MASPQAGPVAFKDVFPEGHDAPLVDPLPEAGHVGVDVEALPDNPTHGLRLYQGTWVPENWVGGMAQIQSGGLAARPGDVVLASPPKCGTTWLKALAFATMARAAHPPGAADHPLLRHSPHECVPFMEGFFGAGWGNKLDALPSPRLVSTHMPYSVLPDCIKRNLGCKIVCGLNVALCPKNSTTVSFSDVFELTCEGKSTCGPIWEHILGYWNAKAPTKTLVLFLRYGEMLQDTVSNVRKLAQFLRQPFSSAKEESGTAKAIVKLCSFDGLSGLEVNKTGNVGFRVRLLRQSFFRKGGAGDWANHMTPEMACRLDSVMRDKLHGLGLHFA
ncbi:hypothetical protein BRADI_3g05191v3 [Brachypodium distachyon]|uniref:Sulfotransferase n=1 Tax=Brachypodium distachyon TaxID=15368 RepID=A0A0Q3HZC5_BRADI|nr:hypothetical protein BRADI_3g05191v3 [Brachypodium distachyon]